MKKSLKYIFALCMLSCSTDKNSNPNTFITVFEKSNGIETASYQETISFYEHLADTYTSIAVYTMGKTDSGNPLHLVTFNPNRTFESEFSNDGGKNILLINNGIHPGESDGIDASMLLMRDYATGKIKTPINTIIAVIPIYNIGGSLNRNSTTRTNQNGPVTYGFRGNARNYDLNRDFIKADTKNARAFMELFRTVNPDVFIDTHVSNGADYQYILTHLFTQHNKLGGDLGHYVHKTLMPALEDSLRQKSWDITSYVNVYNRPPDLGFSQFQDPPRYSTGYTTLFNTIGMMVETHMLKPYKQRVEGTYALMKSYVEIIDKDSALIKELRKNTITRFKPGEWYPIQWKIDSTQPSTISFKGYESELTPSNITGANRLKYDQSKPYIKEITYYDNFIAIDSISVPEAYIIPQGWWNVIELLKLNKIKMKKVQKDTVLTAQVYKITSFETVKNPYEGHYVHYKSKTAMTQELVDIAKGDYIVNTEQAGLRYILETLEPSAPDSFFNWNFFDTILQQKEGFSPYVWEDMAEQFLKENPDIKAAFEVKKLAEPRFANNWYSQLDWIHKQSAYYERSHFRYPIVRVGG